MLPLSPPTVFVFPLFLSGDPIDLHWFAWQRKLRSVFDYKIYLQNKYFTEALQNKTIEKHDCWLAVLKKCWQLKKKQNNSDPKIRPQ